MILFINACVRSDSRTKRLADSLLLRWEDEVTEVRLGEIDFPDTNEKYLARRDCLIAKSAFDDPMFSMANQFASADRIVIAAPYWDLSFPAALKHYFEHINVPGITFKYAPEGYPVGLCRAGELFYVTTAGGNFVPEEFGFGYVKALAQNFYGIQEVQQIRVFGLDMDGADVEEILSQAVQ